MTQELKEVVRCVIHPGIGIARVGNSPDEYFVGPEVPWNTSHPGTNSRDAQHRIKRQAARFRIYALNREGKIVQELNASRADIQWTVHLANKKAAWYEFHLALNIPEAQGPPPLECRRRNAAYSGHDREKLVIDPGPRSISGRNKGPHLFDTGTFLGVPVPLGELRTDPDGNLLVLGGFGHSGTPVANNPAIALANNDGWYDDISDGTVTAKVVFRGRVLDVTSAWVIVAPPNYAPGINGMVTLYDVAYNAFLESNPDAVPRRVSFREHIHPIFQRLCDLQWVNRGFYLEFGWRSPGHLLDPSVLAKLADNSPHSNFLRFSVFKRFRNPDYLAMDESALPPIYGDGMNIPPLSPRQYLTVTKAQYAWLESWARGDFLSDWSPNGADTQLELADLPLEEQPRALDRAALENCLGGPFHPGYEAGWPMRVESIYSGLCRLKVGEPNRPSDFGEVLLPSTALAPDGPLCCSSPGDITRWMSVPWQADVAGCRFGFRRNADPPLPSPYLPTFWPARIPNHVLTRAAFRKIVGDALSERERIAAFEQRENWLRHLDANPRNPAKAISQSITLWSQFGLVVREDGPAAAPSLPRAIHAEAGSELDTRDGQQATPKANLEINPGAFQSPG
jgi:hypothetical protein